MPCESCESVDEGAPLVVEDLGGVEQKTKSLRLDFKKMQYNYSEWMFMGV